MTAPPQPAGWRHYGWCDAAARVARLGARPIVVTLPDGSVYAHVPATIRLPAPGAP